MKEKILRQVASMPLSALLAHIERGDISFDEVQQTLQQQGGPAAQKRLDELESAIKIQEQQDWTTATQSDSLSDYQHYLLSYPNGDYVEQCQAAITRLEDEAAEPIAWQQAQNAHTIEAYQQYIVDYPMGQYVSQAQAQLNQLQQIAQIGANAKNAKKKLEANCNAFSATQLQQMIQAGVLSWEDLADVYEDHEIQAIQDFQSISQLPDGTPPEELADDRTEVYFWGTPASGKTCALGAILSAADKYGALIKNNGASRPYMDLLSDLFVADNICSVPAGTASHSIHEMLFELLDDQERSHKVSCIDLAGEVLRALYQTANNTPITDATVQTALDATLEYLDDERNKKIHFFVVPYNEHDKKWNGITIKNYLSSAMQYLTDANILSQQTVAVYVLVTKSDNMPCSPEERKSQAEAYLDKHYPSLSNSLSAICKEAGIGGFEVMPFSVGKVFAQQLCIFDKENPQDVLARIIGKTPAESNGRFSKIFNWFKS